MGAEMEFFDEFLEPVIITFYKEFWIHGKVTRIILQSLIMVVPQTGKYNQNVPVIISDHSLAATKNLNKAFPIR